MAMDKQTVEKHYAKKLSRLLADNTKTEEEKRKILRAYYKKYIQPYFGKYVRIIYKCNDCKDSGYITYSDKEKNRYAKRCKCERKKETDIIINKLMDNKLF